MSKKLILVRYDLDNGIPIDYSSENISEAYIPDEFVEFLKEEKLISELRIKELKGEDAEIEISIVNDEIPEYLKTIIWHVDNKLIRFVKELQFKNEDDLIISIDLDKRFSNLFVWLNIRNILKEKMKQYDNNINIKLVVG